jgi:hypothetical protein
MIALWQSQPSEARELSIQLAKKHIPGIECVCAGSLFVPINVERFLLFHELHFVLRPTTFDELFTLRSGGRYLPGNIQRSGDRERRRQTLLALQAKGHSTFDFSNQIIGIESSRLKQVINEFGTEHDLGTLDGNVVGAREKLRSKFFRFITCCNDWPDDVCYVRLQAGRFNEHKARLTRFLATIPNN